MNFILSMTRRLVSINKFPVHLNSVSKQLIPRCLSNHNVFKTSKDLEEELRRLKQTEGKSSDLTNVLRKLVISYTERYHSTDPLLPTNVEIVSRVKQIAEEFNQINSESNDSLNSGLMEFFTKCGDLESALSAKTRISRNFRLDSFKVINLATLLVIKDKTNAAINLIESERNLQIDRKLKPIRDNREDIRRLREKSINKLLNTLIDKQTDVKTIESVFKICVDINLSKVNRTVAGPLIRMHLVKQDFDSALKDFLFYADNYGAIPWSLELMRVFIKTNDEKSLRSVVKKTSEVIGTPTATLELSVAYLYNGMESEAKQEISKFNDKRGIRLKSFAILCDKLITDNKYEEFKTFLQMTQSIEGIDRQNLFQYLKENYYKNFKNNDKLSDFALNFTQNNTEVKGQNI